LLSACYGYPKVTVAMFFFVYYNLLLFRDLLSGENKKKTKTKTTT